MSPHPQKPPFADLAEKLGIDPATLDDYPLADGEPYATHAQFLVRRPRFADGQTCPGTMRVEAKADRHLELVCDGCGFEVAEPLTGESNRDWLLAKADLPERFAGKRFEPTPESEGPRHLLRAWLEELPDPLHGPAIYGPLGTGKTHLLTMVCKQLVLLHGRRVLFLSVPAWLADMQAAFERPAEREQLWNRAVRAEVLALDDLGAEQATDWRLDTIHDLIDRRDRAGAAVMLSSNVRPDRWAEAFDPRTASRLRGMTFGVELKGPDRRQLRVEPQSQEAM